MSDRQWILRATITILLIATANVSLLVALDNYGIFRSPRGRDLAIYFGDRMGKQLLNREYVPANFDALLIGPSSSGNWAPKIIVQGTGMRMYNESLYGGNAAEEKLLVDRALVKGRFRVAMVVLYPTMIESHGYRVAMDKVRWTEALGSLNAYVQALLSELATHRLAVTSRENAYGDGSYEMGIAKGTLAAQPVNFSKDPVGLSRLQAMLDELRAREIRVVYVFPAVYQATLERNQAQFSQFTASMVKALPPAPVIDLTAPEYKTFRSKPDNFLDSRHVTVQGGQEASRILNTRLIEILR